MSVLSSCALFRRDPAAVHAAAETHDTRLKELLSTAGLGLGTTDQVRVCALAGLAAAVVAEI
jgi:hypothetical protein